MMQAASWRFPKTRVRTSGIQGRGLFAVKPIREREIVSIRGGHILTRRLMSQRRKPPGYWGYPIADGVVLGPLTKAETQSVMMFLNHSCEPNIGIQGQIVFVAMRNIRPGEELSIDYAMFGGDPKSMRCRCGAPACRKIIVPSDWKRKTLQAKYGSYFSWQVMQWIANRT
jgi:SET domain-containing protein